MASGESSKSVLSKEGESSEANKKSVRRDSWSFEPLPNQAEILQQPILSTVTGKPKATPEELSSDAKITEMNHQAQMGKIHQEVN